MGNVANGDDGDGVVGGAEVHEAHQRCHHGLCATAAIDAMGEYLNDVFHAPIVANYAQQTSRQ